MTETTRQKPKVTRPKSGITKIRVGGFKSINEEHEIDIFPLTILAGANSSGKSSIMQPLLLLKQTLEVTYDPGALWLNGPNVKFTNTKQFLSRCKKGTSSFSVGVSVIGGRYTALSRSDRYGTSNHVDIVFSQPQKGKKIDVQQVTYQIRDNQPMVLYPDMPSNDIRNLFPENQQPELLQEITIIRDRFFLAVVHADTNRLFYYHFEPPSLVFGRFLQEVIHLPGLRGNPERTYPITAVGSTFPGTFDTYAASVIAHWQEHKQEHKQQNDKIEKLSEHLHQLGLTWKVQTRIIDETQVELQVGRLPHSSRGGAHDMVNIADVGFGVSQTLPALVALLEAKPGQLVYLEQPEIHLHPRAQTALAGILADAARRGVRVVVETHSSLLLLGVQTLVAQGELPPDIVKLHWFSRDDDGNSTITSTQLDETGSFGEWPQDFDDVELAAQDRYLNAVAERELGEA